MKVEITMEKVQRVTQEYDVTEEQLHELKIGINPFEKDMEQIIESGNSEYDYSVNDENGRTIVDWA